MPRESAGAPQRHSFVNDTAAEPEAFARAICAGYFLRGSSAGLM
jgi:hypothetical protein